jgi:site-specific DNA-methyltransferase (adenine-specific)
LTIDVVAGDCLQRMQFMADDSFDSCVTDPPYHLTSVVKRFGAVNAAPAKEGTDGLFKRQSAGFMGKTWDGGDIAHRVELWAEVFRLLKPGAYLLAFGGTRTYHRMACAIEDAGFEIRDMIAWTYGTGFPKSHNTDDGRGTALKPALEPICMARKPLIGTVAENIAAFGTGVINIEVCKVHSADAPGGTYEVVRLKPGATLNKTGGNWRPDDPDAPIYQGTTTPGRWPANLIHDGSDEVIAAFPQAPGQIAKASSSSDASPRTRKVYGKFDRADDPMEPRGDSGSAARFFYSAKASKHDRAGSKHPTVKPISLIRYLIRLVTPAGGHVLDPFAGSGTLGAAAIAEGLRATLIEREPEYLKDISRRLMFA